MIRNSSVFQTSTRFQALFAGLTFFSLGLNYSPALSAAPLLSDYQLVFEDEFNGDSLDPSKWYTGLLWGPYFPINAEEQFYVDTLGMHKRASHSPFEVSNSTLKITATPTSDTLQPPARPAEDDSIWKPNRHSEYVYNGPTANGPGYRSADVNYLSGIITSYGSFRMTHGYVETRAKLPAGRGLWPAFWLLNTHYVDKSPEIDVMEFLGQDTDTLYHTYHYFEPENNWAKVSTPSFQTIGTDWTEDFHVFGMAWSPKEIVWYVDGNEVKRITDSEYTISRQSMYLIANLAVGGNWPGPPDSNTIFPATFEIDYIRAYKRRQSDTLDLANDFQLMFSDEFSGSTLDESKWNTHFLWGPYLPINNEEQYYVDALGSDSDKGYSPFALSNGILSITAQSADATPDTLPPEAVPHSNADIWQNFPTFRQNSEYTAPAYTSGLITSYNAFKFVNGYAELRAKVPSGDGLWPAFWLLNSYYVGDLPEIDVMEFRGENTQRVVHSYHRSNSTGQQISTSFDSVNDANALGYADGFHTYGVRWQPGKITWYVDGQEMHSLQDPSVAYQLMYVIANLAVGGSFHFSETDPDALPASLDIDYIRVYQEKDTEVYAGSGSAGDSGSGTATAGSSDGNGTSGGTDGGSGTTSGGGGGSTQTLPAFSNPTPAADLSGNSIQASWAANATAVSEWWIYAGTSSGSANLYDSGSLGTSISHTIPNLPANGSTVYLTLWYRDSGGWQKVTTAHRSLAGTGGTTTGSSDGNGTSSGTDGGSGTTSGGGGGSTQTLPAFSNPAPAADLSGNSIQASWAANATAVSEWWIYAGTSSGSANLYDSGSLGTSISHTIPNLPANGSTVYLTLWYRDSGGWQKVTTAHRSLAGTGGTTTGSSDGNGTSSGTDGGSGTTSGGGGGSTQTLPAFSNPAPAADLSGNSIQASWAANATAVSEWWIYAGTSSGSANLYDSGSLGTSTSHTIPNLPANGSTVYLTLWYRDSGGWQKVTTAHRSLAGTGGTTTGSSDGNGASGGTDGGSGTTSGGGGGSTQTLPAFSNPTPTADLSGNSIQASWAANATAVSEWWIYAGTSSGSANLYDSGSLGTSISHTIPNLPANGSTVYLTLWYKIGNSWRSVTSMHISKPAS